MNTLAYSTNSLTSTPDDLRGMRGEGDLVIRKPRTTKQPFSRLTAPAFNPALATRNPGVASVAARTVGSQPA